MILEIIKRECINKHTHRHVLALARVCAHTSNGIIT